MTIQPDPKHNPRPGHHRIRSIVSTLIGGALVVAALVTAVSGGPLLVAAGLIVVAILVFAAAPSVIGRPSGRASGRGAGFDVDAQQVKQWREAHPGSTIEEALAEVRRS